MALDASIAPARRVPRVDVERLVLSGVAFALVAGMLGFVALRLGMPADGTDVRLAAPAFGPDGVSVGVAPGGSAAAAAIRPGDGVVAVFGRPIEAWAAALLDPAAPRPAFGPGDRLAYSIARDGRVVDVTTAAVSFDAPAALAEDWGVVVLSLAMFVVGVALYVRRPGEAAIQALLVLGTAMFTSTTVWALGLQVTDLAIGTTFWLYALGAGVAYALFWSGVLHFALVFPRPHRFATSQRRLFLIAYAVPLFLQLAAIVAAAATRGALPAMAAWIDGQVILQVVVSATALTLLGYSFWRLPDPASRSQLRWITAAAGLAAVSAILLWFGPEAIGRAPLLPRSAVALLGLPFPVALAVAVDRHHLFELDRLVNRSLVYGGLTAGIVLTYAATVALIGGMIPGNAPFAIALLGTGAVAVVSLPLRARLQRAVDRFMYGDRDRPDEALRRLGRRLEGSLDPQTVPQTLVDAVADALRSPYVAIEFERDGLSRAQAAYGQVPIDLGGPRELVRVPIVYRGLEVGRLVTAERAPNEAFSAADERLLADLVRQAAPAVEAVRLTADLRRSREALVATREEERRRLRRDLHDELGPTLAGSAMKLGAARSLIPSDPTRAAALLGDLESSVRSMIDEVRRIARDLRPPALDELGLVGVLRQHVAAFDGGSPKHRLRIALDAPDDLPALPAAVEVAGLRIALEGLTNAARHAAADHVTVRLAIDGEWLVVSVIDDGAGIRDGASPGVGLVSMRERADELGGSLEVESAAGAGTSVVARLPLASTGPA
jgi:signal transduction histidine kinase